MYRSITVSAPNAGRRVDAFLKREMADVPRAAVMKWIRTGLIRVNGKRTKPESRLAEGDELRLPMSDSHVNERAADAPRASRSASSTPRRKPSPAHPARHGEPTAASPPRSHELAAPTRPARHREPTPASPARSWLSPQLSIIYEDDALLIVDKPAHLPVHAGTGHERDSLAARIEAYLDSAQAPVGHKPGLAQRLDSGVSGLVPIGKNAAVLRVLAKAVTEGRLRKIYRALILGSPKHDEGDIRLALRVDDQPMGNKPRTVPDPAGLAAHTTYKVVERLEGVTVVDVEIHTGRTHQIRAHMRAIGHPLLADPRYGSPQKERALKLTLDRPALHARRLELEHPITGAPLIADAPMPHDLEKTIAELRQRAGKTRAP